VNPKGLDFYQRVVDRLLSRGIEPFVTLYHWDHPWALEERGGWLNPDLPKWFAEYAWTMYQALDDRVRYWASLNEPWVVMHCGYLEGIHPPGHRSAKELPRVAHHLLLAHGEAVRAYRDEGRHQIGIVVNLEPKYPVTDRTEDRAACSRAHAYMNRQFLDPVLLGRYPQTLQAMYGADGPAITEEDLKLIHAPVDFIGINCYSRAVVKDDARVPLLRASSVRQEQSLHTEMDWEVYPQGLTDCLLWVKRRYGDVPLYITENGAAFTDPSVMDGDVRDPLRIDYLRRHLRAVHSAMAQGVDVRGYFVWSLFDNFEWSFGYSKRFGIVHVDQASQVRTLKASAKFFAEVIRSRGTVLVEGE
jgi:beta-glucosidase